MIQKQICLENINQVNTFNQIAARQPFDVDLVSGRYRVDAKSIMGIFSLNLNGPLLLELATDRAEAADVFQAFFISPE